MVTKDKIVILPPYVCELVRKDIISFALKL